MTTYTGKLIDIPTGLDEQGYRIGLPRLPHETPESYRMRLLVSLEIFQNQIMNGFGAKLLIFSVI